ncbi:hypothetical protein [Pantoea coffeiphila]|uniref:Uncharacterized protein n=1 Tax=Pantoea coffeiphila TaxID=1465635 RepID=A0A2S9I851_9GAMM|nr:hypothetical protein [Pantoea coffeiphila]PRD13955.1 hypothetical protein CQW29_18280 [Pantoea coffeiphila]
MNTPNSLLTLCFICLITTACTTQKALKETKRQFDNGEYGWALYTGTVGVTVAAIADVFTLGGTSDVNTGTSALSSAANTAAPNSSAAKALSSMASAAPTTSSFSGQSGTTPTAQASDSAALPPVDVSTFNTKDYLPKNGQCAKNLSYLSDRLPAVDNPNISQIRQEVLKGDMLEIMRNINKEGKTPDEGIQLSLQQAEAYDKSGSDALQTAEQTDGQGITAAQFAQQIKAGTLKIDVCDGIRNSSLCAATIYAYGAIGSRAAAANLQCYKRTNQWPKA